MRSSLIRWVKRGERLIGTSKSLRLLKFGTLNKEDSFSKQILKRYDVYSVCFTLAQEATVVVN